MKFFIIVLCWLMTSCGNEKAGGAQAEQGNKEKAVNPTKPAIRFLIDNRLVESDDYICSWIRNGKQNIFNLTVHYDRDAKKSPANLSFTMYNLQDPELPITPFRGSKLNDKSGQVYSLSMNIPGEKSNDMNEQSYSDNYPDLKSAARLISLDTTNSLVSGSFSGVVQNANGKMVKINEGKFELIPFQIIQKSALLN